MRLLADAAMERQRIAVSRAVVTGLVALMLVSETGWHELGVAVTYPVAMLGVLLATGGALGRLWCAAYISGNKNGRLVTEGPYSLCRNPLYFFSFVGAVGVALTTETLAIPALLSLAFALCYPAVIRQEEERLAALYPEAFAAYRRATPCFLPSLANYREAERAEISLVSFRRALTEAIWFVVAAALCHALDDMRLMLGLTGWFRIY